jgi:alpha-L-fucosidase
MKPMLSLVATGLFAALAASCAFADLPPPVETPASAALAKPTPGQVKFQEMGFGLFVHWSPSVYQGTEGDNLKTPKDKINPDRFDAEQFVKAAKSCGAGYIVFVAKHVGGYCAWQTKTTDYSLTTSPWKNGKGDMVGELAAACQKAGIKFGVYLCPRDDYQKIGNGGKASSPDKQPEVDAFYRQQLTELLTQYGTLFEVWFDGGNRIPVNDLLDKYAPDVVTFQGRRHGSSRWVGTEHGHAPYPCWNAVDWKEGEIPAFGAGTATGNLWAPAECDVSILRPNWFWRPGSDGRVLSLEALNEIYYLSVGRSANLLLNVTPDDHGVIPEAQMQRLAEFGTDIQARFGKPVASTQRRLEATTGTIELALGGEKTVNHLRLREDIRGGERTRKFKVLGKKANGTWTTLAAGSQIGACQIIPFAPATVTALKLEILEAVAPASIQEFAVFHVDKPVPALAYREGGRITMRAPKLTRSLDGTYSFDCPNPDWDTRYTLDGTEPTRNSPIYHEPQACPKGAIIQARYFDREDKTAEPGPVLVRHLGLPAAAIKVVRASSQDQREGQAVWAFDANPKTMWHTAWRPAVAKLPHEIVLDLSQPREIIGMACLGRQDAPANQAASVQIFVCDTADAFPEKPQFEGTLGDYKKNPQEWHEAIMPNPATGRFVKLVFPSVAINGPCMAAAEMEIMAK